MKTLNRITPKTNGASTRAQSKPARSARRLRPAPATPNPTADFGEQVCYLENVTLYRKGSDFDAQYTVCPEAPGSLPQTLSREQVTPWIARKVFRCSVGEQDFVAGASRARHFFREMASAYLKQTPSGTDDHVRTLFGVRIVAEALGFEEEAREAGSCYNSLHAADAASERLRELIGQETE